jgi:hypothetical protein
MMAHVFKTFALSLSLASFTLASAGAAAAEAQSCADAYTAANHKYQQKVQEIADNARGSGYLAAGAGGIFVLCSLGFGPETAGAAILPCAVATGGIAFFLWLSSRPDYSDLHQQEQVHKVYVLYNTIKSGTVEVAKAKEVQEFVRVLGVDIQREADALGEVTRLMESGSLCRRGRAATGFDELVTSIKYQHGAGY